jgi:outer membrane protein
MLMKSSFVAAAASICLALGAHAQQAAPKVGVISVQGAIVGTHDGQKASQELETKFNPKKKEFDSRQSEIAQLQDQYNKGGSVMNDEKRNQLARDIDEKKKRLERDMQDANEELQSEQQKVLQGLGQRMMAVIEKYAKDNGYTMILDVSNPNTPVLYASSGIDITQDIVQLYDKTSTNGGPATTPSAASPAPGTPRTPGAAGNTPGTPRTTGTASNTPGTPRQ